MRASCAVATTIRASPSLAAARATSSAGAPAGGRRSTSTASRDASAAAAAAAPSDRSEPTEPTALEDEAAEHAGSRRASAGLDVAASAPPEPDDGVTERTAPRGESGTSSGTRSTVSGDITERTALRGDAARSNDTRRPAQRRAAQQTSAMTSAGGPAPVNPERGFSLKPGSASMSISVIQPLIGREPNLIRTIAPTASRAPRPSRDQDSGTA